MDKMDINIQYAEKNDFLWLKEHDKYILEEILKDKIERKEVYVVKFKYSGKNIGWLRYNLFWDNIPFMNMIYILEDYWKMGIGNKLVKHWENEMKQNGHKNVLTSTQSNEEAQHFYRKIGYKEIGGFNYLDDPYEIMFQKYL
jgi:ribosomal protein S18 acetylase RimI-like enzyme